MIMQEKIFLYRIISMKILAVDLSCPRSKLIRKRVLSTLRLSKWS